MAQIFLKLHEAHVVFQITSFKSQITSFTHQHVGTFLIRPWLQDFIPFEAAALLPPIKTKKGKGIDDHLMTLGYLLFHVYEAH